MPALWSDSAIDSWLPVHGPRQDSPEIPGQALCSGMGGVLSLGEVTKSLVRSQVVLSDNAHSEVLSENYPRAMAQFPKSGH